MGSLGASKSTPDGIAVMDVEKPCNLEAVPDLIKEVVSVADELASGSTDARQELLIKLRTLSLAIETPREIAMRHCWTMVRDYTTLQNSRLLLI